MKPIQKEKKETKKPKQPKEPKLEEKEEQEIQEQKEQEIQEEQKDQKETVKFIEENENGEKKRMTTKKKKRIEKAKAKISLKERRKFLFEELSKIMLTDDELPNIKSTTKLGIEMDSENKENIIIMPKKAVVKQKEKKKEEVKEEEKVTKLIINDGKTTFGFGFLNDQMEIIQKQTEQDEEKKKENKKALTNEKVLFIANEEESSSDEDDEDNQEENEDNDNSNGMSEDSNSEENEENDDENGMSEDSENNEEDENENEENEKEEKVGKEMSEDEDNEVEKEQQPKQEKPKENEGKRRIIPIEIPRTKEINEKRKQLPILMEENNIIETILNNETTIICGQTGSGKTTQIPQILFEIGFGNEKSEFSGMIGITQPRRIAAIAMANRVKEEMGEMGNVVSHQIRYESTVSKETKIKFMTDGILLREVQSDLLLSKYSCIIIDEAHERSLNTDVLIGLLSRIIKLRNNQKQPFRLIIMSATLRINEFVKNERLFKVPPEVIKIDSRQYSVRSYFSKRTELDDYCQGAIKRVNKIHNKLPPGGILVFLTGHREIEDVCSQLRNTMMYPNNESLHVLPLYSSLDPDEQVTIFEEVPKNKRLCVVSTNVAETSITIPNIKYVIDSGRVKERVYDMKTGISRFVITWITKASAEQRSGRAGRVGEGYCFRLYSSNIYAN